MKKEETNQDIISEELLDKIISRIKTSECAKSPDINIDKIAEILESLKSETIFTAAILITSLLRVFPFNDLLVFNQSLSNLLVASNGIAKA